MVAAIAGGQKFKLTADRKSSLQQKQKVALQKFKKKAKAEKSKAAASPTKKSPTKQKGTKLKKGIAKTPPKKNKAKSVQKKRSSPQQKRTNADNSVSLPVSFSCSRLTCSVSGSRSQDYRSSGQNEDAEVLSRVHRSFDGDFYDESVSDRRIGCLARIKSFISFMLSSSFNFCSFSPLLVRSPFRFR